MGNNNYEAHETMRTLTVKFNLYEVPEKLFNLFHSNYQIIEDYVYAYANEHFLKSGSNVIQVYLSIRAAIGKIRLASCMWLLTVYIFHRTFTHFCSCFNNLVLLMKLYEHFWQNLALSVAKFVDHWIRGIPEFFSTKDSNDTLLILSIYNITLVLGNKM